MRIAFIVPDNRDEYRRYGDPEPYFGPAPTALLDGFNGIPELDLHIVCCVQKPLRSPERIAPNIHYHSILVPKLGWLRGVYVGCVTAIRRKLRTLKPDIVHGQGTERYCGLAAAFSGFPNVITIHVNMLAVSTALQARCGSFHWLTARLENVALGRTNGVFCNSAYTENLVAPRTRRTWRVPNALSPIFLGSPPARASTPGIPVLISLGHVQPYKRQLEILRVAEQLHRSGCRFQIWFVGTCGSSKYQREFLSEIARVSDAGFAKYLGPKNAEEVLEYLDQSHAMVHFPTEESFGLAAAEGLARNLKFFGSDIGGLRDITAGVDGAVLLERDDYSGLEQAIRHWLQDGAPMLNSAAGEMQKRYHPERVAARHLEIYSELLASKLKSSDAGSGA